VVAQARDRAEQRRREAVEQRRHTERLLTRLALDRGLSSCESGDVARGLLWMARSLQLAPDEAGDLRRIIRVNLTGWGQQGRPPGAGPEPRVGASAGPPRPTGGPAAPPAQAGPARLGDRAPGRPIGAPRRPDGWVPAVAFRPAGGVVATAGEDGTARIWDAQ